ARVGLPGHGTDLRGVRPRPRPDDRLESPCQGAPVGRRRPTDARVPRAAPRRRGGADAVVDLERARPLDDRVDRLSEPRTRQRPPRDAPGPGRPRLRTPRAGPNQAPAVVQGSAAAPARGAQRPPRRGSANVSGILEDLTTLSPK